MNVKTYDELYTRWAKEAGAANGEVADLPEERRAATALMLENQRLIIERQPDTAVPNALDIVKKVMQNVNAFDYVSVQPLLGPAGMSWYTKYKFEDHKPVLSLVCEDILAKTRKLKTRIADDVDEMARSITCEINNEILTDLYNNCGTVATIKDINKDCFYYAFHELRNVIHRKTLRDNTYVPIVSKEIYEKYHDELKYIPNLEIADYWTRTNGILMVSKREHPLDRPYIWAPYIMLTKVPTGIEDDPNWILMRYGKKLLRDGAKAYGRVVFAADAKPKEEEPFPVMTALATLLK